MKLLLDENISDRIVPRIIDLFPGSTHVKIVGLRASEDAVVWEWARAGGFEIVSKDIDFLQRAIAFGPPPKFIWLRVGNCPTAVISMILRSRAEAIRQFGESATDGVLVLERPA